MVAEVRAKLAALDQQLKEATDEKNAVEANAEYLKNRGNLADRLINGLSSEKIRWETEIVSLRQQNQTLIGDSMLAAGFSANDARVYIASRKDCAALAEELSARGRGGRRPGRGWRPGLGVEIHRRDRDLSNSSRARAHSTALGRR